MIFGLCRLESKCISKPTSNKRRRVKLLHTSTSFDPTKVQREKTATLGQARLGRRRICAFAPRLECDCIRMRFFGINADFIICCEMAQGVANESF